MIGAVLGTRYRIIDQLGEGSMGQVYLAEHLDLGRKEAIKVLQPGVAIDPAFVSRFRREARATNRVQHPNIVSVYDFGQLPDGRLFLSMEYAQGTPLDRVIRNNGPMPVSRMLHVMHQLASAVQHAHDRHVVHRDLKPSNMILVEHRGHEDVLKILDFGIAKIVAPDYTESVNLTRDGEIFGTPEYMAPEQFLSRPVTPAMDLYAVGCIGFELLAGEPPFRGRLIELIHAHTKLTPRTPSALSPGAGIPPELDALIAQCLAKEPSDRPLSGEAIAEALTKVPGFPGKKASAGRSSRGRIAVPPELLGHATPAAVPGTPGDHASVAPENSPASQHALATADTAFLPQGELHASMLDALLELAEALIDHGSVDTHITQLTVAVANLISLRDDDARLDNDADHFEAVEARVEQATREREGPLRFAIGELRFDADQASAEQRGDLTFQIQALENRLKTLLASSRHQLDEITDKKIEIAAQQAHLADEQAVAYEDLRALVDSLLPSVASSPAVTPLIHQYMTLRDLVAGT